MHRFDEEYTNFADALKIFETDAVVCFHLQLEQLEHFRIGEVSHQHLVATTCSHSGNPSVLIHAPITQTSI